MTVLLTIKWPKAEAFLADKAQVSYIDLAKIPLFNQDIETPILPEIAELRAQVDARMLSGFSHQYITMQSQAS